MSPISLPLNSYLSTDVWDVPAGGQQEHRGHAGQPGQGQSCHGSGTVMVCSLIFPAWLTWLGFGYQKYKYIPKNTGSSVSLPNVSAPNTV